MQGRFAKVGVLCLVFIIGLQACGKGERTDAASSGIFEAVKSADLSYLENLGPDDEQLSQFNENGSTPLLEAVLTKNPALVKILLEKGADVNLSGTLGYEASPLMFASSNPDPTLLNLLLDSGANIDAGDKMGDPAINWASYYGHKDIIETLLKRGARSDLRGHGNALEISMRRGFQQPVKMLHTHQGTLRALSEAETKAMTAIDGGDVMGLQVLIENGFDVNGQDETNQPLLHRAARGSSQEIVKSLLNAGADINQVDQIGFTALFEAAREGRSAIVELLIKQGAEVNIVSHEHALSLTALHLASIGGDIPSIEFITNAGADMSAVGTQGNTALLWGVYEGKIDGVIAQLALGADPHIKNVYEDTLISVAGQMNDERLNEALATLDD